MALVRAAICPPPPAGTAECPASLMGSACQGSGLPTGAIHHMYSPRGPSPRIEPRNPAISPGCQPLKHHSFIIVQGTVLMLGNGHEQDSPESKDAPKMGFQTSAAGRSRQSILDCPCSPTACTEPAGTYSSRSVLRHLLL